MDRDLPLKPTLAFLACFILAIIVYAYFAPLTVKPPIGQLYKDSNHRIWVMEKNYLVALLSEEAGVPKQISLAQHGINQHIGQLIPLQSGEYLINSQGQTTSITHHIKRFLRLEESENTTTEGSLLKCEATFVHCEPWGESRLFFNVAWSGLELSTGLIILNDTTRHRVLLLSPGGKILSEMGGFKFPNHAVEDGDNVWIVDTNHNRLVALSINNQQLSKTGEVIHLSDYQGIQRQHNWPSVAALDAQKNWWVMINDSGMAHPGVYRLNVDKTVTQYGRQLEDASFMLLDDKHVYISQYPENVVWAFSQDMEDGEGKAINNTELTAVNYEVQHEISANKRTMWLIIAAIATVGIALLAYAIKGSSPAKTHARCRAKWQIDVDQVVGEPQMTQLLWIDKNERFMKKLRWAKLGILLASVFVFVGFAKLFMTFKNLSTELGFSGMLWVTLAMEAVMIVFAFYTMHTIQKRQLGVMGKYLLIRQGSANQAIKILGNDILYTDKELYAKGTYLFWQNLQDTVFEKQPFEQYVVPILQQGKRINSWQLLIARLKDGDMTIVMGIVFIVLMLLATFMI